MFTMDRSSSFMSMEDDPPAMAVLMRRRSSVSQCEELLESMNLSEFSTPPLQKRFSWSALNQGALPKLTNESSCDENLANAPCIPASPDLDVHQSARVPVPPCFSPVAGFSTLPRFPDPPSVLQMEDEAGTPSMTNFPPPPPMPLMATPELVRSTRPVNVAGFIKMRKQREGL